MMGQIVRRKKKGRPSKADLARRSANANSPATTAQSTLRRSRRPRNVRYNIDYDDYLDEEDEDEDDDERGREKKKLKLVEKLNQGVEEEEEDEEDEEEQTPHPTRGRSRVEHAQEEDDEEENGEEEEEEEEVVVEDEQGNEDEDEEEEGVVVVEVSANCILDLEECVCVLCVVRQQSVQLS